MLFLIVSFTSNFVTLSNYALLVKKKSINYCCCIAHWLINQIQICFFEKQILFWCLIPHKTVCRSSENELGEFIYFFELVNNGDVVILNRFTFFTLECIFSLAVSSVLSVIIIYCDTVFRNIIFCEFDFVTFYVFENAFIIKTRILNIG